MPTIALEMAAASWPLETVPVIPSGISPDSARRNPCLSDDLYPLSALVEDEMGAPVIQAVAPQAFLGGVVEQRRDRQLVMDVGLVRDWREEVDRNEARQPLELGQKRIRIVDVLDDVERVRGIPARGRRRCIEVIDGRFQAAPVQTPAEVLDAGVGEVRKADLVAGLEQEQAVASDAAAVVEDARATRQDVREVAQVRLLRAAHRESREVVEVHLRGAVERRLVAHLGQLLV